MCGIVAGTTWIGPSAGAHHSIAFVSCEEVEPELTPPPDPEATTDPYEPPSPPPEEQRPDDCVPPSGEKVRRIQNLVFSVDASGTRPIETVEAFLISQEEGVPAPEGPIENWSFPDTFSAPSEQTFTTTWDTDVITTHNGRYTFRVTADPHGPHPEGDEVVAAERVNLIVDNRPTTPQAPKLLTKAENKVTLEWEPVPEPDILAYSLYRAKTTNKDTKPFFSQFSKVQQTPSASVRDTVVSDGTYWYRIVATRRSAVTPDQGISSGYSAMSAPIVVVGLDEADPQEDPGGESPPPQSFGFTPPAARGSPPPVPGSSVFDPVLIPAPQEVDGELAESAEEPGAGATDPRGSVLPVAVGTFLVSSALVLGRMPY